MNIFLSQALDLLRKGKTNNRCNGMTLEKNLTLDILSKYDTLPPQYMECLFAGGEGRHDEPQG
jgi:hypothetical protein